MYEILRADGDLLQGSTIFPVQLQTPITQHPVIVGQVSPVFGQTNLPGTKDQVVPGLAAQESRFVLCVSSSLQEESGRFQKKWNRCKTVAQFDLKKNL